jgi:SseB protein N-terminal domain
VYGKTVPASGFSGDDGSAHREVTEALAAYRAGRLGKSELVEALTNRRLMVAVVATVLGEGPVATSAGGEPAPRRGEREPTTGGAEDRSVGAGVDRGGPAPRRGEREPMTGGVEDRSVGAGVDRGADAPGVRGEPAPRQGERELLTGGVEDRSMAAGPPAEPGVARVGVEPRAGRGFPSEKAAEVMLATIKGSDGRIALPAFTSLDALSRWKAGARPVPASTQRVCAGALSEGADLVVIDPAGPATVELSGAVLWALAEGRAMVPLADDLAVIGAIRDATEDMARAFSGTFLQPGADQSTDLVIQLVARAGADPAELREAAAELASRLAADPIMRSRVDRGVQIAVVNAPPPGGLQV